MNCRITYFVKVRGYNVARSSFIAAGLLGNWEAASLVVDRLEPALEHVPPKSIEQLSMTVTPVTDDPTVPEAEQPLVLEVEIDRGMWLDRMASAPSVKTLVKGSRAAAEYWAEEHLMPRKPLSFEDASKLFRLMILDEVESPEEWGALRGTSDDTDDSAPKVACLAAVPALVAGMDVMTLGISLWVVSVGVAVLLGCLLGRRMHSTGLPSRNGLLSQQEMLRRPVYWQEVMDAEIQRLKAPYDETRPENTDETVAWWR